MDISTIVEDVRIVPCDTYPVIYNAEEMQIGCELHAIKDWWSFDDERIIKMGGKEALRWWRTWKPFLQHIIETSPANATR